MTDESQKYPTNFIRAIVERDVRAGKNGGAVLTRFPPEPNGYLHIGHAKAICLNFGIAADFGGQTNLRFDDTDPTKESQEYMDAMMEDVRWLGFEWADVRHASDYFEQLYEFAVQLIRMGKAYVDSLSADEIREHRGTLTEPGRNSPWRDRPVAENLDLFHRMRNGEFEDGEHVLRARIDMAAPNINMRDPIIYRIRNVSHFHTGNEWCIYPMYDFTHCLSDSIEGITHSLCDLSFEDHRPLYDWVLDELKLNCHPQQIEFSRLNLQYTMMSKRKLKVLVDEGLVDGWDDPRLPTLAGMRRRGYRPDAIRDFCRRIGVTKADNTIEMAFLENCIREDLEPVARRVMGVLDPLPLVIDNYPEEAAEELDAPNHPKDPSMGERKVPFTRRIYIDRADFREEAPRKYRRLVRGGEVRLRYGYVIRCEEVIKSASGEIEELRCTYDPATLNSSPEGRKVQGVIHWVSASRNVAAEIRLFEPLFTVADPDIGGEDYRALINPDSLTLRNGFVEESLASATADDRFQFEREGYFCLDSRLTSAERPVFNRIAALRDSWLKLEQKEA